MSVIRRIATLAAFFLATAAHAMTASSIPTKVPTYWGTGAQVGYITCPIPIPSQINISAGRASWTDGFPPLTFTLQTAGGVPINGLDLNGALCQLSQWTRWSNAGAPVPYDSVFQSAVGGYPQGAIIASSTTPLLFWLSAVDNNSSNPDTGGAGWQAFVPLATTSPVFQGRLTLVSGTPVMLSTVVGQSVIYYAPFKGNLVSIYNGIDVMPYQFTSGPTDQVGQSLTLGSSWAANSAFDVFDTIIAGSPALCTVAWSSLTARATTLALYDGFRTNASSATCQTSNSSSITLPQNQGTYLGSFYTDANSGEVDFNFGGTASGGMPASLGIWNYYNQSYFTALIADSGISYSYFGGYREARGSSGNQASFMIGAVQNSVTGTYGAIVEVGSTSTSFAEFGIGFNVTNSSTCLPSNIGTNATAPYSSGSTNVCTAYPALGVNVAAAVESAGVAAGTFNFAGLSQLRISVWM